MTDIREKIAHLIYEAFPDMPLCERVAERIRALPEMVAGQIKAGSRGCRFVVMDTENSGCRPILSFDIPVALNNGDTITIPPFKITND